MKSKAFQYTMCKCEGDVLTAVFGDVEINVFLHLLQMRWWPSTGCGSSWRHTRSTVRSCAVFEQMLKENILRYKSFVL